MSVKVLCRMADCVNWDNGLCGAEEIRIDREGYCATYEEIPEEATDELELSPGEDLTWEEDEEEIEVDELGQDSWQDVDEEEEEDDGEHDEDDPWDR